MHLCLIKHLSLSLAWSFVVIVIVNIPSTSVHSIACVYILDHTYTSRVIEVDLHNLTHAAMIEVINYSYGQKVNMTEDIIEVSDSDNINNICYYMDYCTLSTVYCLVTITKTIIHFMSMLFVKLCKIIV